MNNKMLRRVLPLTLSVSLVLGASAVPALASPGKAAEAIAAW